MEFGTSTANGSEQSQIAGHVSGVKEAPVGNSVQAFCYRSKKLRNVGYPNSEA